MKSKNSTQAKTTLRRKAVRLMALLLAILAGGVLTLAVLFFANSPGRPQPFLDDSGNVLDGSISEKIQVEIGGVSQGMFIRGKNINNPVLLFLHGGPGMPEYFLSEKYQTGLEDMFTVCYWEQRGAGISYTKGMSGDSITSAQLISDTIAVTNYLRERFGQEKIYLMAHSWGTFIGIQAAAEAPELYSAYIGMGQISDQGASEKLAYAYMLDQYEAFGNTRMVDQMKKYPLLEDDAATLPFFISMLRDQTMHQLGIGTMHDMTSVVTGIFLPVMGSHAYTAGEKITLWRAKAFLRSETGLLEELFSTDLSVKVPALQIPVYFMSGIYDYTVSYELSRQYFDKLQAPVKGFYTFKNSAHTPLFEEPEKFLQILRDDVL